MFAKLKSPLPGFDSDDVGRADLPRTAAVGSKAPAKRLEAATRSDGCDTGCDTVLLSNGPSWTEDKLYEDVLVTPGRDHSGGVNAALSDGRVRFIADDVDTGNLRNSSLNSGVVSGASPYGVWGGPGTHDAGEVTAGF